ncbi:MAG: glucosaminidase [Bacteroidetes bacterium]|nr:MAG: glucosaminidase [Bacteroidota bacterium]
MTESPLKKSVLLFSTKVSFLLFISIILSFCNPKKQKTKQKIISIDSVDTYNISGKNKANTSFSQKKEETKEVFIKSDTKNTIIISSLLPDFSTYKNVKQKKKAFFSFLTPLIQKENRLIIQQRQFIQEQYQIFKLKDTLSTENITLLNKYILDYRCENTDLQDTNTYNDLLLRVDIIPQELALVQAALESSWGSSYFVRAANNLYGQWCFKPGCGVIPRARKEGETHEVAKFETLEQSIRSYMLFLNSHPAFSLLRKERAIKRKHNKQPDAISMANGLKDYSARGQKYIKEIKSMLQTNKEFLIETTKKNNALTISSLKVKGNSN